MNTQDVPAEFVTKLLESRGWSKAGITTKPREVLEEAKAVVEEEEDYHTCPLCESELEEELSEEAIVEFTSDVLDILEEAEESLEEEDSYDDDDDEDEDDEDEEDEDEQSLGK